MKLLLTCLSLVFFSTSGFAGGEVRNGGGGWTSDGQYMTFYSAKIPAQRSPLEVSGVPGLNYLIQKILTLQTSENVKNQLLTAIFPTEDRSYHSTNASQFDEKLKQELRQKYAQLMNIPVENVVLFATTDPESRETILLPEFYQLKETEQAAILFHEALWVLNPLLKYADVVAAESAAQAFFEQPLVGQNVYAFYSQLSRLLKDATLPLAVALHLDTTSGVFPSFTEFEKNYINLNVIFDDSFLTCLIETATVEGLDFPKTTPLKDCAQILLSSTIQLSMRYPSSFFLKALVSYTKAGGYVALTTPYITSKWNLFRDHSLAVAPKDSTILSQKVLTFDVANKSNVPTAQLNFY
ncbi:MAG: hypothetical protein ACKOX6_18525 [Bdellovibrio sp.]